MIQAKTRNRLPVPQPAVVHLRRSYADGRYGQIHLWTAYPSGGGFDERTPLICLHPSGGSGRAFTPVMCELGSDRSVYAPDLPGHGTSDATPARFSAADLAGAVCDFLDSLRLRTIDVAGGQLGAAVAVELALARPQQVRRIMLWDVPAYSSQDRVALLAQPGGLGVREDGADVAEEWRRLLERRGPGVPVAALAQELADRVHAGASSARGMAAALDYPAGERLPLIKQSTLLLRPRDDSWDQAPRVRALLPNATMVDLPELGANFLAAAPARFIELAREFLDR
ncbi:MAG: alpha/beta fold hydrolase [Pseudomonadota bacterium]